MEGHEKIDEKLNDEQNMFDEIESMTTDDDAPSVPENKILDERELMPNDMSMFTWLKNPDVGESIVLDIAKIIQREGREILNKATGSSFMTGLEDKNGKRTETIIETVNGERFNITSWGLYFKLFGKDSEFMKLARVNNSYKGLKVKITHMYNGKDATTTAQDLMKLRGFKTLEEAEKHKSVVGKAMKEQNIYQLEVLK